jgi:hypothetical protein
MNAMAGYLEALDPQLLHLLIITEKPVATTSQLVLDNISVSIAEKGIFETSMKVWQLIQHFQTSSQSDIHEEFALILHSGKRESGWENGGWRFDIECEIYVPLCSKYVG